MFAHAERLEWFEGVAAANTTGALIAWLLVLAGGITEWLHMRRNHRAALGVFFVLVCPLAWALLLTQSRGALVAVGMVALVYAWRERIALRWLAFGAVLVIIGLVLSGAWVRFDSLWSGEPDASATMRLKVWKGALQVMADAPLIGVSDFWQSYERWYQPLDEVIGPNFSTPLNVFLTLGVRHGSLAMAGYFAVLGALLAWGLRLPRTASGIDWLLRWLTYGLLVLSIAGMFTTIWHESLLLWLNIGSMAILLGVLIRKERKGGLRKCFLAPMETAFALVIGCLVLGWGFNVRAPVEHQVLEEPQGGREVVRIQPQNRPPRAHLLLLPDFRREAASYLPVPARLFAEAGYTVTLLPDVEEKKAMLRLVQQYLDQTSLSGEKPLYLMGRGAAAEVVLAAIETKKNRGTIDGVFALGLNNHRTSIDLPKPDELAKYGVPVHLIYAEHDYFAPKDVAKETYHRFQHAGLDVTYHRIAGADYLFSNAWEDVLHLVWITR